MYSEQGVLSTRLEKFTLNDVTFSHSEIKQEYFYRHMRQTQKRTKDETVKQKRGGFMCFTQQSLRSIFGP